MQREKRGKRGEGMVFTHRGMGVVWGVGEGRKKRNGR